MTIRTEEQINKRIEELTAQAKEWRIKSAQLLLSDTPKDWSEARDYMNRAIRAYARAQDLLWSLGTGGQPSIDG